jgi:mRNA-degrading endonuclease RelE of RelBE toxin-antitoxin system
LTSNQFEFLKTAEREFNRLPRVEQLLFEEELVYLLRNPFQSHSWLRVRQGARHPGEWRFHLGEYRVFYRVEGLTVVFTRIGSRARAYPRRVPKARRR